MNKPSTTVNRYWKVTKWASTIVNFLLLSINNYIQSVRLNKLHYALKLHILIAFFEWSFCMPIKRISAETIEAFLLFSLLIINKQLVMNMPYIFVAGACFGSQFGFATKDPSGKPVMGPYFVTTVWLHFCTSFNIYRARRGKVLAS